MIPDTKICVFCQNENKKSEIGVVTEQSNDVYWTAFYSEDGKLHSHNPNYVYTVYKCTNGHVEEEKFLNKCWCGWGSELNQTKQ
jgi:hypothetical protein